MAVAGILAGIKDRRTWSFHHEFSRWLNLLFIFSTFCRLSSGVHAGENPALIKVLIVDGFANQDWQRTTRLTRGMIEPAGVFQVTVATAPGSMTTTHADGRGQKC